MGIAKRIKQYQNLSTVLGLVTVSLKIWQAIEINVWY